MADIDYFELSESTLEELSGQGDTEAMIALALGLYFGSFGEMDADSAYDWFSKAYRKGEVKAAPFLAEMIYFQQVSISGFDSDEDYCRRAYELYEEGEERGMVAAIRGICKMMLRGDYLEEDVDGAYERLKELENEDEECAYLVGLLEDGTLTDDDIIPCNEFGDNDEEESEEADGDEGIIRRWLERDTPESDGFNLSVDIDEIIHQLRGVRCPSCQRNPEVKVLSCPDAIGRMLEQAKEEYNSLKDDSDNKEPSVSDGFPLFIPDSSALKFAKNCPECGSPLEHEGGCVTCRECGWSKCN